MDWIKSYTTPEGILGNANHFTKDEKNYEIKSNVLAIMKCNHLIIYLATESSWQRSDCM